MPFPPTDLAAYLHGLAHTVPLAVTATAILTATRKTRLKTELESGAWVEHRPIQDLKAKDKDAVSLSVKMAIPITEDGEIDRSQGLLMSGSMQLAARNAVLARVITGWSYEQPVPYFEAGEVHEAESIDEIPIDDFNEIEELLAPYLEKLRQRPDPKGAITSASNGSSRANSARSSRQG